MITLGPHPLRMLALAVTLLAASGCVPVTVNVYFPQEKIDSAAGSIEDLVRVEKGEKPATPPPAKKDGKEGRVPASGPWLALLAPAPAEAQIPDLKVRTPEVMASIESRRARFPQIQQWKGRGCIGENAQGLVEARPGQGCGAEAGALIDAENRDRMTLYRTLLQQNNMAPSELAKVQAGFAKANRERAQSGEWIQAQTGQWTRK
ncbi:MAG: DUF1318 domain-containing protein [Candidatus Rokubacteria bacterium]|nr:DUF1318 domain-containing protein [Candidatus Rokubacteria bacterium]